MLYQFLEERRRQALRNLRRHPQARKKEVRYLPQNLSGTQARSSQLEVLLIVRDRIPQNLTTHRPRSSSRAVFYLVGLDAGRAFALGSGRHVSAPG